MASTVMHGTPIQGERTHLEHKSQREIIGLAHTVPCERTQMTHTFPREKIFEIKHILVTSLNENEHININRFMRQNTSDTLFHEKKTFGTHHSMRQNTFEKHLSMVKNTFDTH